MKVDPTREYGLVLEGGGAKGAYEIGAWMALREAGICIKAVAGASVGALNGALICMDDVKLARNLWENIQYSQVIDVEDEQMGKLFPFQIKQIPELVRLGGQILRSRGFNAEPLQRLIAEQIDPEKIRKSGMQLFVTTCCLTDRKALVVEASQLKKGLLEDLLMASSYLIGFKQKKIRGKYYLDGAYCNNVPVDVLIDRGYKDIIVIRIYGFGVDTEKRLKVPSDVRLYHICPSQYLGGILEFDSRRTKRNIMLGYRDAKYLLENGFDRSSSMD